MEGLYRKKIMNHYLAPRNKGKLKKPFTFFEGKNPSCGDEVNFYLKMDSRGQVKEVGWEGNGCVVSMASSSILSEQLIGKTLKQIQKFDQKKFLRDLEMPLSPTRTKCALMPIFTLRNGE